MLTGLPDRSARRKRSPWLWHAVRAAGQIGGIGRMRSRTRSPRAVRIVGRLLAVAWLGAAFAGIVVGVNMSRWLLVGVGLVAFCYGLLWVRVARLGRQLTIREALTPWRGRQRPDA